MRKNIILGGGPAGLMCAFELAERGVPSILLEKETEQGGLCRSFSKNGFTFDLGGHRFLTSNSYLLDIVKRLLGDDLLMRTRESRIWLNGKSFHYPLELNDLRRNLPLFLQFKACLGYLLEKIKKRDTASFEGWVVSNFGMPLYNLFFKPYTIKLWGVHPANLASSWALQRISIPNFKELLLRLLKLRSGTVRTYAKQYFYPKYGFGQLFKKIGEKFVSNGGGLLNDTTVTKIYIDGKKVQKIAVKIGGVHEEEFRCENVVSTIPLPELLSMITPSPPENICVLGKRLRFRGLRFFNILLDLPSVSNNTWIYVPEKSCIMTRVQEPRNRSPQNSPPGKTSLMLEIPCDPGDEFWDIKDDLLLELAVKSLNFIGIDIKEKVIGCFSKWAQHAYPIYHLTYEEDMKEIFSYLNGIENLLLCGRQGLFRYIFTDTAMEMGILAANWILREVDRYAVYRKGCEPLLHEVEKEPHEARHG